MRDIKFRAWDKQENKMLIGNNGLIMFLTSGVIAWNFADSISDEASYTKQDRYILMQFTGRLDAAGRECYEADEVVTNEGLIKGYIVFSDGAYCIMITESHHKGWDEGQMPDLYEFSEVALTGNNKHQNPI